MHPFLQLISRTITNIIEVVFMNPWLWSWSYNCIFREMLRDDYLTCGFSLFSIFQQIFLSVPVMLVCLLIRHHFGMWAALEAMIIRFSLELFHIKNIYWWPWYWISFSFASCFTRIFKYNKPSLCSYLLHGRKWVRILQFFYSLQFFLGLWLTCPVC